MSFLSTRAAHFNMFLTLFLTCLISAYGTSAPRDKDGDPRVWEELRGVLPERYAEYAEEQGLSNSRLFQNDVIRKLHNQVVRDTQAIAARQQILQEYVRCSCRKCPENETSDEDVQTDAPRQLSQFNPITIVTNLFTSCETSLTLETIKILRVNIVNLQLQNRQLTALVTCNCPNSLKCRKILDPLIFSVVNGANDTELSKIYWQTSLDGFPDIVERGVMDSLQNALVAIMSYFFQSGRPQHDAQVSPYQQNVPPSIFSPGNSEVTWQNAVPPNRKECPLVQVSITNNRDPPVNNMVNQTSEGPIKIN